MDFPRNVVSYLKTIAVMVALVGGIFAVAVTENRKEQFMIAGALILLILFHRNLACLIASLFEPDQKYAFLAMQPFWYVFHLDHLFSDEDRRKYKRIGEPSNGDPVVPATPLFVILFFSRLIICVGLVIICMLGVGSFGEFLGILKPAAGFLEPGE